MITINWIEFLWMLPFCAFGFTIHLLTKLAAAMQVKDYSFKVFLKKQWLGWILAWLLCVLGCYLAVQGVKVIENAVGLDVIALLIGYSGGSAGKNAAKILLGFKTLMK